MRVKLPAGIPSLLLFLALAGVVVAVAHIPVVQKHLNVKSISHWVEHLGIWGPVGILGLSLLFPFMLLPRWPLVFVAGALYGIVGGSIVGCVAGTIGALFHYLVASRMFRTAGHRVRERFHLPEHMDNRKAWILIFTLRAFPLSNYGLTNMLAGALGMRWGPFSSATFIGMIPSTIMYAAWGKLLKKPSPGYYALAISLVVLLSIGSWWMGRKVLGSHGERSKDGLDLAGG
jgi:uncharacterized membrane protein YdjX (TVP38/TMEM64 family)